MADGTVTYQLQGSTITGEQKILTGATNPQYEMEYFYDSAGNILSMLYNGTEYYYEKNGQGDIIGIVNGQGTEVVTYQYDSWGKVLEVGGDQTIGKRNPFRYRGYYYDEETGLYYLESRYYDPESCRFINADDTDILTATPAKLTDKNLFAYCDNNPITRKDVSGQFWDTALDIVSVVVGVAEVMANPKDAVAWKSLTVDVICAVLPGVTGGGRLLRGIAKSDDAVDAANAIYKASNKASDLRKATGSYEILYKNGTTYVGKGGYKRAINSAKRHSKGTKVSSINWKKASSHREAYIIEYKSMCKFGGPNNRAIRNTNSHNKIWSLGRKYFLQANGSYYRYGGRLW